MRVVLLCLLWTTIILVTSIFYATKPSEMDFKSRIISSFISSCSDGIMNISNLSPRLSRNSFYVSLRYHCESFIIFRLPASVTEARAERPFQFSCRFKVRLATRRLRMSCVCFSNENVCLAIVYCRSSG